MSWKHLSDREVRGRKEYICQLCGLRIRKGAKHVVRFGVDCGQPISSRFHAVCNDTAIENWDEMDWECSEGCEYEFRKYDLKLPLIQTLRERLNMALSR